MINKNRFHILLFIIKVLAMIISNPKIQNHYYSDKFKVVLSLHILLPRSQTYPLDCHSFLSMMSLQPCFVFCNNSVVKMCVEL